VVGQSKEDIPDCDGLRDVAMATKFGQNRQKLTKMRHINEALGFEIGF